MTQPTPTAPITSGEALKHLDAIEVIIDSTSLFRHRAEAKAIGVLIANVRTALTATEQVQVPSGGDQLLEQIKAKIESAMQCHPNAVETLLHEAIELAQRAGAADKPVAWSRTRYIYNHSGAAVGLDEPEVVWGAERPDDDPGEASWTPLYAAPVAATADAAPADKQILQIAEEAGLKVRTGQGAIKFARALLAKYALEPGKPAPKVRITLRQAHELVKFFGGHDADVTVTPPLPDWEQQAPGLYAYCTDYPEDGAQHLGPSDVDDDLMSTSPEGTAARHALALDLSRAIVRADAAPACRYPLCQSEAEQDRIAAEVHRQLYTGEAVAAPECQPCNGMGIVDGVGDPCPKCAGEGSADAAPAGAVARTTTNPDGSTSTVISEYEVELETALAAVRDLFPMPDGGDLYDCWNQAVGDPGAVPAYVKAQISALRTAAEVTPAPAATAGSVPDDVAQDAERYRWLAKRCIGYDFYWGGDPMAEDEAGKGACVIVFECGQDFDAGRDFAAAIDKSIRAAQTNPADEGGEEKA